MSCSTCSRSIAEKAQVSPLFARSGLYCTMVLRCQDQGWHPAFGLGPDSSDHNARVVVNASSRVEDALYTLPRRCVAMSPQQRMLPSASGVHLSEEHHSSCLTCKRSKTWSTSSTVLPLVSGRRNQVQINAKTQPPPKKKPDFAPQSHSLRPSPSMRGTRMFMTIERIR